MTKKKKFTSPLDGLPETLYDAIDYPITKDHDKNMFGENMDTSGGGYDQQYSFKFTADDKVFAIRAPIDYKFNENKYLDELKEYIDKTYSQHYSQNKFQSTEVIMDLGHGTGFCMGNVDKYSNRYGKKGTKADARKDLLKVIHYAMLQLYVHDNY